MQRRHSRPLIARASACHAPFLLLFVILPPQGLATRTPTAPKGDAQPSVTASEQTPRSWTVLQESQPASQYPGTFDHSEVAPGRCDSCHNSAVATGKPINHITTSASCDACHTTRVWVPATFDHSVVSPGSCATCHNGITAAGTPSHHIETTATCDNCHRTNAWIPATFDHSDVAAGTCADCHNGTGAPGMPANHIPITLSCDVCHRVRTWLPATFDHGDVASSSCTDCHNGTAATGQPDGHFVSAAPCETCHATNRWMPVASYRHDSPLFPRGHSVEVSCKDCHAGNTENISWEARVYEPDCAGCHADDYELDDHLKTRNPATMFYTVNELRNCAGSCHEYTNNTFAIILETRTSKHRPNRGTW